MQNPNCDGAHCVSTRGSVRLLPTGGDSNAILCYACYCHELAYRRDRNRDLEVSCRFELPEWNTLEAYSTEGK